MSSSPLIMALDQGTTSSRTMIFDAGGVIVAQAQQEFTQHYPADGWVEHDPGDIWETILSTARQALQKVSSIGTVTAIGITNQRETVIIWDRQTGKPISHAIVWQDRRTAATCKKLVAEGKEPFVTERTGLLLDPYFSASKVAWILDNVEDARDRADRGELAFGTVDTFLIWKLTGGKAHVTDETNASRTSLYNIHTGEWDADLLELFDVPMSLLPEILPSAADFGTTDAAIFGHSVAICGVAGDQQSAAFGQACTKAGMAKATYGTGCFVLMNTGHQAVSSKNRLLTTRACRVGTEPSFALEGSIFIAGAVAQWLRDEVRFIDDSPASEVTASALESNNGVYMVPAFTGLGAPYWDSEARGAIYGLTRQSGQAEIVRAALEAVAYQTRDLFQALAADGVDIGIVRVDGGMSQNNWLMQFISDVTNVQLERPQNVETTALGVACLAGLQSGVWADESALEKLAGTRASYRPNMPSQMRRELLREWDIAVKTTRYRARLQQE